MNHSEGHCQGQKGQVWLIFTHFSVLISSIEVLPKCVASCCSQILMVLIDFFKVRKVQFSTLNVIYLGQYLRNGACCDQCLYEVHKYKVIYDLSVDLVIFDLGLHLKVKSRSQTFQGVVSDKWYIIILWSKFVWNTYSKSYMAFQFTFYIWPLMKLEGQIKVIGFSAGYIS